MLRIKPSRIWPRTRTASLCLNKDGAIYLLPPGPYSGYYKPVIISLESIYNYTHGWFRRRRVGAGP